MSKEKEQGNREPEDMDEREWLTQEHDPGFEADAADDGTREPGSRESAVESVTPPTRRGFLYRAAAALVSTVAAAAPAVAGFFVFFDPLRKRKSASGEFVDVTSLAAVPPDGQPRLFRIFQDKQDAWTKSLNEPVGAVYLRRKAGTPDEVTAFNTTCPHAGCFVNLKAENYHCPCHNSTFHLDGSRGEPCVAERGLDSLETKIVKGRILVRFRNFLTGRKEKVPVL